MQHRQQQQGGQIGRHAHARGPTQCTSSRRSRRSAAAAMLPHAAQVVFLSESQHFFSTHRPCAIGLHCPQHTSQQATPGQEACTPCCSAPLSHRTGALHQQQLQQAVETRSCGHHTSNAPVGCFLNHAAVAGSAAESHSGSQHRVTAAEGLRASQGHCADHRCSVELTASSCGRRGVPW